MQTGLCARKALLLRPAQAILVGWLHIPSWHDRIPAFRAAKQPFQSPRQQSSHSSRRGRCVGTIHRGSMGAGATGQHLLAAPLLFCNPAATMTSQSGRSTSSRASVTVGASSASSARMAPSRGVSEPGCSASVVRSAACTRARARLERCSVRVCGPPSHLQRQRTRLVPEVLPCCSAAASPVRRRLAAAVAATTTFAPAV